MQPLSATSGAKKKVTATPAGRHLSSSATEAKRPLGPSAGSRQQESNTSRRSPGNLRLRAGANEIAPSQFVAHKEILKPFEDLLNTQSNEVAVKSIQTLVDFYRLGDTNLDTNIREEITPWKQFLNNSEPRP
nr:unnamed protein product [Callosobruchus chinensis]